MTCPAGHDFESGPLITTSPLRYCVPQDSDGCIVVLDKLYLEWLPRAGQIVEIDVPPGIYVPPPEDGIILPGDYRAHWACFGDGEIAIESGPVVVHDGRPLIYPYGIVSVPGALGILVLLAVLQRWRRRK